jgi:hypothetical protein
MVYGITLVCQQTIRFFPGCFRVMISSEAVVSYTDGASKQCSLEDEIEKSLLEELTSSDQSSCSDDDYSSGTDNLTIVEVTGSKCSDRENENAKHSTVSGAPSALCYIYVGGHDEYP